MRYILLGVYAQSKNVARFHAILASIILNDATGKPSIRFSSIWVCRWHLFSQTPNSQISRAVPTKDLVVLLAVRILHQHKHLLEKSGVLDCAI